MATDPDSPRSLEILLREAALFNLLAKCFFYPSPAHHAAVLDAFRRIGGAGEWPPATRDPFARAARAWRAANADDMQAAYVRWFASDGRCSLHETAYGDGRRIAGRAVELADIQGFYGAFGFELAEQNPDLPDHLCAELEFYSLLLLKQAYAQTSGWEEQAQITNAAAERFLEYHLGRWVPAVSSAIASAAVPEPYIALAGLLEAVVAQQVERLGLSPQFAEGRITGDSMQGDNLICPLAPGQD